MLENMILGLIVMVLCLLVQAVLVAASARFYTRHRGEAIARPTFIATLALISAVMLALVLGNFLQITIWALLFMYLGEFKDFATAVYHSAVNFATLGYGDIIMSEERRILGPMQSVNGVLMVGVSTAVMMAALQDALRSGAHKAGS